MRDLSIEDLENICEMLLEGEWVIVENFDDVKDVVAQLEFTEGNYEIRIRFEDGEYSIGLAQ